MSDVGLPLPQVPVGLPLPQIPVGLPLFPVLGDPTDLHGRPLPPPLPPPVPQPLPAGAALVQMLASYASGSLRPMRPPPAPPPPPPPPARKPGDPETVAKSEPKTAPSPSKPSMPPRVPQASIFVGNIGFDTTEEEVNEAFRGLPGLKQFRLASHAGVGGSRGFGFVEFEDVSTALEALKATDGKDVRGRKLRLRWGEHSATTPEVDDFHRTPERFKTRHCFEIFQGMVCHRGRDCPYAHSQGELRKRLDPDALGDHGGSRSSTSTPSAASESTARASPAADGSFKVPVPFDSFSGSNDEEKQRSAYNAVLGVGAKHMRFMMQRIGCRLQLRGVGDRATATAAGAKEPLHLVVKPGVGKDAVSEEQLEDVRKILAEIAKDGKPVGFEEGAGAVSTEPPKKEAGEQCVLTALHPNLPGLVPSTEALSTIQFFIMRSITMANIQTSVRMGIWATSRFNTEILDEAYKRSAHVVLIFSANNKGHFQGYARMISAPSKAVCPGAWGKMTPKLGDSFQVSWLKQCMMPFSMVDSLRNGLNGEAPLRKSRDGQEVERRVGDILLKLLHEQSDENLLELPVEDDEKDAAATRSRSRGRSPSRSGLQQRTGSPTRRSRSRSRDGVVVAKASEGEVAASSSTASTTDKVRSVGIGDQKVVDELELLLEQKSVLQDDSKDKAKDERRSRSRSPRKDVVEVAKVVDAKVNDAEDKTPAWMKKPDKAAAPAWTMAPAGSWSVGDSTKGSSSHHPRPDEDGPPGSWGALPPHTAQAWPPFGYGIPPPVYYGHPPHYGAPLGPPPGYPR